MELKTVLIAAISVIVLTNCGTSSKSKNQEENETSDKIEQTNTDERPERPDRPERGDRPEQGEGRRKYEKVETAQGKKTPVSAFDEFNPNSVTVSFDGDEITIESKGHPNHTTPYWQETDSLYIKPVIAVAQTPGRIGSERDRSFTLTVSNAPGLAVKSTSTGLGAIGISVTGVPIFNDSEGPGRPLEEEIAETFDYAGGHVGPSGYHYHTEAKDVPENTMLSHNDKKLVGIMADGFLIYGRKDFDDSYPTDLDASGGHFGVTPHSNGEKIYHYHIINEYYVGNLIVLFGGDFMGSPTNIL
ncbi:YHYH protein [Cellulophaga baltica]|uniref:YHYH protein n=1 Tax=Cellulophaga baltica TaxID=76594 RepID=A0A1G7M3Y5_9FLAO|nr:YHYH protein [Cellulophaga baltica]SDF56393.1 YHYH protein [Cellulophaga baltica]